MLGAFGAILPEALSAFGGDNIPGAVWWQVRSPALPAAPWASTAGAGWRLALPRRSRARGACCASPAPPRRSERPGSRLQLPFSVCLWPEPF